MSSNDWKQDLAEFVSELELQLRRKAKLYDGVDSTRDADYFLKVLAEETGEVASAMIRERTEAARAECLDVAHTAFLIWMKLKQDDVYEVEEL